jgi:hypothetical protein
MGVKSIPLGPTFAPYAFDVMKLMGLMVPLTPNCTLMGLGVCTPLPYLKLFSNILDEPGPDCALGDCCYCRIMCIKECGAICVLGFTPPLPDGKFSFMVLRVL